jgi:hypothetical protein
MKYINMYVVENAGDDKARIYIPIVGFKSRPIQDNLSQVIKSVVNYDFSTIKEIMNDEKEDTITGIIVITIVFTILTALIPVIMEGADPFHLMGSFMISSGVYIIVSLAIVSLFAKIEKETNSQIAPIQLLKEFRENGYSFNVIHVETMTSSLKKQMNNELRIVKKLLKDPYYLYSFFNKSNHSATNNAEAEGYW